MESVKREANVSIKAPNGQLLLENVKALIPYAAYEPMAKLLTSVEGAGKLIEIRLGVGDGQGQAEDPKYTDTNLQDEEAKEKSSKNITRTEITERNGKFYLVSAISIEKSEFNRDDTSPKYCEAGLFFADDVLFARATFDYLVKTKDDSFEAIFEVVFS